MMISGISMFFAANAQAALPSNCGLCHSIPVAGASGVFPAVNLCSSTFTTAKQQTMSTNTGGAVTTAQIAAEITATCGGGTTPPPPPANLSGEASTKMYCGICHGLRIGSTQVTPDVTIPGIKPGGTKHMSGNQSASQYAQRIQKMADKNSCPVPATAIKSMAKYMTTVK